MNAIARPRTVVFAALAVVAALVVLAWWLTAGSGGGAPDGGDARLSLAESLGGDASGYARAEEPRDFAFPADHGPHPDFRTEWWYFTGNLRAVDEAGDGRRFGYQLTFFRSAVAPAGQATAERTSAWATRQVWMAHLAVTDVAGNRFHAAERFARGALGLAGAETEPFRVHIRDWSARESAGTSESGEKRPARESAGTFESGEKRPARESAGTFPWRLRAADRGVAIDLTVAPGKGFVLQGEAGLSRKGEGGGASYYYSFPRMPTTGTILVDGERFTVAGDSWLDREWSSALLGEGRVGWDWFALQLDDGRELVAFRLRSDDDAAQRGLDYAALISPQGALSRLDAGGADLRSLGRWRSPASGVRYPSGWRLALPDAGVDLEIRPWIDDQELDLAVRYWEGAVRAEGVAGGAPVEGVGYVELTGYR